MSAPSPTLTVRPVAAASPELREIQSWQYADSPFFVAQMRRFLDLEIPHRLRFFGPGTGRSPTTLFVYRDPAADNEIVGFATLCRESEHAYFTGGVPHYYIPVLSVKPGRDGKGYGKAIVDHLVETAAVGRKLSPPRSVDDRLFLDVYVANQAARGLYANKCDFETLNPGNPIPDPAENDELYVVMAKNVKTTSSFRPATPPPPTRPVVPTVMPPTSVTFRSDQTGDPEN